MNHKSKKIEPWPVGLIILYALFAIFLFAYFAFSQMQRVDLVSEDYYEQELKYQGQIDRMERTRALAQKPWIAFDRRDRVLQVQFPPELAPQTEEGRLHLFRPSDADHDVHLPLSLDQSGMQEIPVDGLISGLWKARLNWVMRGEEYYLEEVIILP